MPTSVFDRPVLAVGGGATREQPRPRPPAPGSWARWTISFTAPDAATRAEAARAALLDLGVLTVTGHLRCSGHAEAQHLTVTVPQWLDVPALEYALLRTGAVDVRAEPVVHGG